MNKQPILLAIMATLAMISTGVNAENSEKETTLEEQAIKEKELNLPQAVIDHMAYIAELDARYPDSGQVDIASLLEKEGETAALSYCRAIGFDGPCTIDEASGQKTFVAVGATAARAAATNTLWWSWLNKSNVTSVGVIPEQNAACYNVPYTYRPLVAIHMDDEDRRNANSRWGWLGATTSSNDTTWRFCKVETFEYGGFLPLREQSAQYDYAVLNLGLLCPSGARRVMRYQDNEDRRNGNSSYGNVFPNVGGRNWITYTCQFDGGKKGVNGIMSAFPDLAIPYGVFGSSGLLSFYAVAAGSVYQDDEDFWNINSWAPAETSLMGGTRNTWRNLVKIK